MNILYALYRYSWAFPGTLVGLIAALAGVMTGGRIQFVRGVLEVHGGFVTWFLKRGCPLVGQGGAAAMTLGHVILGCDGECLARSRNHEHVHVRQFERWGPLMIPAYLGASAWLWCRGRDPYLDNPFEREAYGMDEMGC